MQPKHKNRDRIISSTDPGQGARLATKDDFMISESKERVEEAIQGRMGVIQEMENRIEAESNRSYPNQEYIARCRKIQEEQRRLYEAILARQQGE